MASWEYQEQIRVFGLYRRIELIGVGQLFPRSAGRAEPRAPTDQRRDLILKAFTAQDEATVGRISKAVEHVLPIGRCPAGADAPMAAGNRGPSPISRGQHAAYVRSWVQVLKEDPKEILRAARDADKISRYVLGLEKDRMPSNIERLPEVPRTQSQPAPTPRATRVRTAAGRER